MRKIWLEKAFDKKMAPWVIPGHGVLMRGVYTRNREVVFTDFNPFKLV